MDDLIIAINAALHAGKKILEIYNSKNFKIQYKSDNSPLTIADIESNKIITGYLNKTDIPILSEEGKSISYEERKTWDKLWIVDPIDGTKEFIKRNGEFTVNIALVENQKPTLGVIYAPVLSELYFSSSEIGARKINIKNKNLDFNSILRFSEKLPRPRIDDKYTIVASRSHLNDETKIYIDNLKKQKKELKMISKGSSLKLCLVAEGSADCYPRFAPTMEWDTAAGQAICSAAGFDLIDLKTNKPMIYNRRTLLNNSFIIK